MEIQLNESQVHEAIVNAITNSVVGEKLKESIEAEVGKAIRGGFYDGNGAVRSLVHTEIQKVVKEEIDKKKDFIKQEIAGWLTDEKLSEIMHKGLQKLMESR